MSSRRLTDALLFAAVFTMSFVNVMEPAAAVAFVERKTPRSARGGTAFVRVVPEMPAPGDAA